MFKHCMLGAEDFKFVAAKLHEKKTTFFPSVHCNRLDGSGGGGGGVGGIPDWRCWAGSLYRGVWSVFWRKRRSIPLPLPIKLAVMSDASSNQMWRVRCRNAKSDRKGDMKHWHVSGGLRQIAQNTAARHKLSVVCAGRPSNTPSQLSDHHGTRTNSAREDEQWTYSCNIFPSSRTHRNGRLE